MLVALAALGGLLIAFGTEQVDGAAESVGRVDDAFPDGPDRPAPTAGALTFLVMGVDPSDVDTGGIRTEAALLVRLTGDRQHVQVVTLAPDTWVEAEGGTPEETFAGAGPQGAVRAVEGLSGVRADHYAELDFAGLAAVTEALGGITVDVPAPYRTADTTSRPDRSASTASRRSPTCVTRALRPAPVHRTGTGWRCRPSSTGSGNWARSPTSDGWRACSRPLRRRSGSTRRWPTMPPRPQCPSRARVR